MSHRPSAPRCVVALLWAFASGSPALAANVEGEGTLDTNLPPPLQSDVTSYDAPDFLDVAHSVQVSGEQACSSSPLQDKFLSYSGQAQFGRLAVRSHIGGQLPCPDLSTSVSVYMSFNDQIEAQNLSPLPGNYWRLDVELSGEMMGYGATDNGAAVGKLTSAGLEVGMGDVDGTFTVGLAEISFAWFGEDFFVSNTSTDSAPRFVPYPGEEPRFIGHDFGARGYIDVPFDGDFEDEKGNPVLLPGDPFLFWVIARANSSCGNENPTCLATTDFGHTARIENARIVDQNGDPVAGASFTSTSGYDYITSPVPEPQTWVLTLVACAALGIRDASRRGWARRARRP